MTDTQIRWENTIKVTNTQPNEKKTLLTLQKKVK